MSTADAKPRRRTRIGDEWRAATPRHKAWMVLFVLCAGLAFVSRGTEAAIYLVGMLICIQSLERSGS